VRSNISRRCDISGSYYFLCDVTTTIRHRFNSTPFLSSEISKAWLWLTTSRWWTTSLYFGCKRDLFKKNKRCAWRQDMPPPLSSPCGRRSASRRRADRRACRRQRSSSFPRSTRSHTDRCSCLCVNAVVSKPVWWPWPLAFWPWKWYPSHMWCGLPVCQFWPPQASLFSSYSRYTRQRDVRQTSDAW